MVLFSFLRVPFSSQKKVLSKTRDSGSLLGGLEWFGWISWKCCGV